MPRKTKMNNFEWLLVGDVSRLMRAEREGL